MVRSAMRDPRGARGRCRGCRGWLVAVAMFGAATGCWNDVELPVNAGSLGGQVLVSGGVRVLAQTTSLLLLIVFTILHVAVLRLKQRDPDPGPGIFRTPAWTPILGALVCGTMISQFPHDAYLRALVVVALGLALYVPFASRTARAV